MSGRPTVRHRDDRHFTVKVESDCTLADKTAIMARRIHSSARHFRIYRLAGRGDASVAGRWIPAGEPAEPAAHPASPRAGAETYRRRRGPTIHPTFRKCRVTVVPTLAPPRR